MQEDEVRFIVAVVTELPALLFQQDDSFLQRFSVTVKYFTSGSCAEKQRITVKCTKCFKSRKTS